MVRPALRLALFFAIHLSLAAIGFWADAWFVWAAVWIAQAFNFLTVVAIVHECTHVHWFGSPRADHVTGVVMATIGITCFEAYRPQHLLHHAHTCADGDPEGEPYKFTSRWQIVGAFFGGAFLYVLFVFAQGVAVAFGYTPSWLRAEHQRQRIRWNVAVLALVFGGLALAVVADVVSLRTIAFVWLIPASIALIGPIAYVLIPEHYDAPGPGPVFTNTRTCTSNPVMRFFYLNTNLHTAHHHRPALSCFDLPAHHAEIEDRIEPEWLFGSYTSFHRFMWRTSRRPASHLATSA